MSAETNPVCAGCGHRLGAHPPDDPPDGEALTFACTESGCGCIEFRFIRSDRKPESVCLNCGTVGDGPGPAHACGGSASHPGDVAPLRECIEAFKRLPGIEGERDEISAHAEGVEQTLDEVRGVLKRRGVVCEPVLAATVERLVVECEAARRALAEIDDLTRLYVRGEEEAPETVGEVASIARRALHELEVGS